MPKIKIPIQRNKELLAKYYAKGKEVEEYEDVIIEVDEIPDDIVNYLDFDPLEKLFKPRKNVTFYRLKKDVIEEQFKIKLEDKYKNNYLKASIMRIGKDVIKRIVNVADGIVVIYRYKGDTLEIVKPFEQPFSIKKEVTKEEIWGFFREVINKYEKKYSLYIPDFDETHNIERSNEIKEKIMEEIAKAKKQIDEGIERREKMEKDVEKIKKAIKKILLENDIASQDYLDYLFALDSWHAGAVEGMMQIIERRLKEKSIKFFVIEQKNIEIHKNEYMISEEDFNKYKKFKEIVSNILNSKEKKYFKVEVLKPYYHKGDSDNNLFCSILIKLKLPKEMKKDIAYLYTFLVQEVE